ncbi:MAG: hypothetical protein ABI724_04035 [Betaproteobacteria bacterium]
MKLTFAEGLCLILIGVAMVRPWGGDRQVPPVSTLAAAAVWAAAPRVETEAEDLHTRTASRPIESER